MESTDATAALQQAWMAAADAGDLETLRPLLADHPELLDARVPHQPLKMCTALHVSAWRNRSEALAFLLAQGADVRQLDEAGMTALQTDLLRLRLEEMRNVPLLRLRGADVHSPVARAAFKRRLTPDRSAYHEMETRSLDLLLAGQVDVNHRSETGDTALVTAVELGFTEHARKLLASGADARVQDAHGRTVLDIAGENGFVDIVELLAVNCPDLVASAGEEALAMATRHDFSEVLETLYGRVQSALSETGRLELGGRLLHTAVEYGSRASAEYLLGKKAPVCWENNKGENAIEVALTGRQAGILEVLLQHQASNELCLVKRKSARPGVAVLRHKCTEMEVLGQFEPEINWEDEEDKLSLFPRLEPWGLQSMEVLVRHGAQFEFPTRGSRDDVAFLLAQCLCGIAPHKIAEVAEDLVNCIDHHNVLRRVLVALVWSQYTPEVLTLVLLALFSSHSDSPRQALAILEPWLATFDANVVTKKLLADSLQTPSSRTVRCSKKQ